MPRGLIRRSRVCASTASPYVDGPRSLIVRDFQPGWCRVSLDLIQPEFVVNGPHEASMGFHFIDVRTGAPLRFHRFERRNSTVGVLPRVFNITRFGFDLVRVGTESPEATVERCDHAGLAVVRTTTARALTRTIEIPELRIAQVDEDTSMR